LRRRFIIVIFFLLVIIPFTGTWFWLKYQKINIRKQVKEQIIAGIDADELIVMKFSKNEIREKLRWEHSGEFEYDQQMYDVAEIRITDDSVYIWCWYDKNETELNNKISELVIRAFRGEPQNTNNHERLFSFLKCLYFDETPANSYIFPGRCGPGHVFFFNFYTSLLISPYTPPPRLD